MSAEIPLLGGTANRGRVHRVGDTVRRPLRPTAPAVHALLRHLEKDLGPLALPQLPPSPVPFTIAEYFPSPSETGLTDDRQHAVALAYLIPVTGECNPRQDALELSWLTPSEALSPSIQAEFSGGHADLLRQALAHAGWGR